MTDEDYVKLNEILEDFLEKNKDTFYCQHLEFYFNKIGEIIYDCDLIDEETIPESSYVDFSTGINLVEEYLRSVDVSLVEEFKRKFNAGQINFYYFEDFDGSIEEWEKLEYINGVCFTNSDDKRGKEIVYEDGDFVTVNTSPTTFIEIGNKKTSYFVFVALIHEFIHSAYDTGSDGLYDKKTYDTFGEFFSVYYELDFMNFLSNKGIKKEKFSELYFRRYNAVIKDLTKYGLRAFTLMLLLKKRDGVIDKHTSDVSIFGYTDENLKSFIDYFSDSKIISRILKIPDSFVSFIFAYYLSKQNNPEIKKTILEIRNKTDKETVFTICHKLGMTANEINELNFGDIMNQFREEINLSSLPNLNQ